MGAQAVTGEVVLPPMKLARQRGRPRDQDSADTRLRILNVAMAMFARDGYEVTTNRSIAEASGAIYHYFASKAELYAAVFEAVVDRVFSVFETAIVERSTLVEQYAAVLDVVAMHNRQDPTLPAFVVGVASDAQRHPELDDLLRPSRRRSATFFRCLVRQAADRGELPPGTDLRAVEDLLNAVVSGLARLSAVTGDPRRHATAVDALQRFLAGTLMTR
ncbi:MAG: TetR/AcrR family transcriptional regulator [Ilumatobacteraceae bacterium]